MAVSKVQDANRGGIINMKVEFKNGFRITSDSLQFIVEQKRVIKESRLTKSENVGKTVYSHVAFCPKIDQALRAIANQLCLDIDGLQDIKIALNSLEIEIKAMSALLQVEVKFDAN